MEHYNIWADLLDTFQSSPGAIKALCLLIPPAFVLGLVALVMRYRLAAKRIEQLDFGEVVYADLLENEDWMRAHRNSGRRLGDGSLLPVGMDGGRKLLEVSPQPDQSER